MSRYKKYLRVYVNGKKRRSSGSHKDDFIRIFNMFNISNFDCAPQSNNMNKLKFLFDHFNIEKRYENKASFDLELVQNKKCLAHKHLPFRFLKLKTIDGSSRWICTFNNNYDLPYLFDIYLQDYKLSNNKSLISAIPNVLTLPNDDNDFGLYYTLNEGYRKIRDFESESDKLTKSYVPNDLIEYAVRHGLKIGLEAYKANCQRFANEMGVKYIDPEFLPSYYYFENTVVEDYGDRSYVNLPSQNHEYESHEKWRYYNE
jgi:hypothetical protein